MASNINNWISTFSENTFGKDFVVGDIHGCFNELLLLLSHVRFNPKKDRVFCVGDLVDRGQHSTKCLDLLFSPWFFAVRGNHEQMILDYWDDPLNNAPYDTSWLKDISKDQIQIYKYLINKLPHVIHVDGTEPFFVLHAEIWDHERQITNEMILNCDFKENYQAKSKVLWSRHVIGSHQRTSMEQFHSNTLNKIFCGHTIVQLPIKVEQSIYLDTGAFVPYFDPQNSNQEHFGLSIVNAKTLEHWIAPTHSFFRGRVINMGTIKAQLSNPAPYTPMKWELN